MYFVLSYLAASASSGTTSSGRSSWDLRGPTAPLLARGAAGARDPAATLSKRSAETSRGQVAFARFFAGFTRVCARGNWLPAFAPDTRSSVSEMSMYAASAISTWRDTTRIQCKQLWFIKLAHHDNRILVNYMNTQNRTIEINISQLHAHKTRWPLNSRNLE